jgi:hypothetical protein
MVKKINHTKYKAFSFEYAILLFGFNYNNSKSVDENKTW